MRRFDSLDNSLGRPPKSPFGLCAQRHTRRVAIIRLPLVGFLPADDPRIASAVAAIEGNLMEDGLVRRKPPMPNGREEGAFFACSCWLADCHKMQGRDDEAAALL